MKLFNPAVFNSAVFNTGGATPPPPHTGGHHRRPPVKVTLAPVDREEAALVVAFLRHRFRL